MQQGSFDVKDLRRLENVVSKRTGIRINCDSLSPPVLSQLILIRREIRTLMMRLGVDDSEMQADLIYMARSWRNRDPFTYAAAHK